MSTAEELPLDRACGMVTIEPEDGAEAMGVARRKSPNLAGETQHKGAHSDLQTGA